MKTQHFTATVITEKKKKAGGLKELTSEPSVADLKWPSLFPQETNKKISSISRLEEDSKQQLIIG